ncbi:hypothetical protein FSP39_009682, partial [Pinctada imbricata]
SADCKASPNGNYEIGCRSYVICKNGTGTLHNCPDPPAVNTVYNHKTGQCDDPKNVGQPCGEWRDCTGHPDKRYPDLFNNCTSYYTCFAETFFGHNLCTPGLVFDSSLQTCNWPQSVPAPCGTKPPKTTPTPMIQ